MAGVKTRPFSLAALSEKGTRKKIFSSFSPICQQKGAEREGKKPACGKDFWRIHYIHTTQLLFSHKRDTGGGRRNILFRKNAFLLPLFFPYRSPSIGEKVFNRFMTEGAGNTKRALTKGWIFKVEEISLIFLCVIWGGGVDHRTICCAVVWPSFLPPRLSRGGIFTPENRGPLLGGRAILIKDSMIIIWCLLCVQHSGGGGFTSKSSET